MFSGKKPIFVARQPIYDADGNVTAYEVLFRRGMEGGAGVVTRTESAMSIVNAILEIGLNDLVGDKRAFINVTEELLLEDCLDVLPKDRVVIEVLENVRPLPEVVEAVRSLVCRGYTIALDDFVHHDSLRVFTDLATIVKLDVQGQDFDALRKATATVRRPGVQLLAEKVEDRPMYARCKRLGFDLYQGYFFMKPHVLAGSSMRTNRVSLLRLLTRLQDSNARIQDLEDIIRSDVTLSYRLLRLTHTVEAAARARIETVAQAIQFLGVRKVSSIAMLLALAGADDVPQELIVGAFTRAHMSESLARSRGMEEPSRVFLAGLLSVLDAIMNVPMEQALEMLPISDEIRDALVNPVCENAVARLLREVKAYELGDWDAVEHGLHRGRDAISAYLGAIKWSHEVETALEAA